MNFGKELRDLIEQHLEAVKRHLNNMPPDEQREILRSIETHIYDALEARTDSEPTIDCLNVILDELDPPASYGEGIPEGKKNRRPVILASSSIIALIALIISTMAFWPRSYPSPVGTWFSVDFVESIAAFDPQSRAWKDNLHLTGLTFRSDGTTGKPYFTWTDNILHHSGNNTDATFDIRMINGREYLFLEWMSGDVIYRGMPPKYYVLQRARPTEAVPYELAIPSLKGGDQITIDEVLASSPYFLIGDIVKVKGHYSLKSHSEANLLLSATATRSEGRSSIGERSIMRVSQGDGAFELTYRIPCHGCLHLSFYERETGMSIGGVYFGTQDRVEEIQGLRTRWKKKNNDDSTASFSVERAWQQTDSYTPPHFDTFFPDSIEGGQLLDTLWNSPDKEYRSDEEILQTVRQGLRHTSEHRTLILRWIGTRFIWNNSPQHPDAIEIMYHAADFGGESADPYGTRHYAVYFGLSTIRPKPPAILRTLAELSMRVDDPNDLGRIAWGVSMESQKDEFLSYLEPFLCSEDEATRKKAKAVQQIIEGDINAFAWAKAKDS